MRTFLSNEEMCAWTRVGTSAVSCARPNRKVWESRSFGRLEATFRQLMDRKTPPSILPRICKKRNVSCAANPHFARNFRDAKSLNQQILSCWSSSQVFSLWQAWKENFNEVNVVTAYYTLAKVCKSRQECENVLVQIESSKLSEALVDVLPLCGCQSIANVTYAMAKLGHSDDQLAKKIANISIERLSKGIFQGYGADAFKRGGSPRTKFFAREVASILTSIAKMQHVFGIEIIQTVFGRASKAIQDLVNSGHFDELRPRVLVNLSWSFATVHDVYRNQPTMDALAVAAAHTLRTEDLVCDLDQELGLSSERYFSPQGLANLAWSFAKVSHNSWDQKDILPLDMTEVIVGPSGSYKELFQLIGNVVAQQLTFLKKSAVVGKPIPRGQWKPIDFAHLAWSFARVGHRHPDMYPVLVETALESSRTGHTFIDQFDERSLAMFAWGNNAAVGCYSSTFFDAVAARYLNLLAESILTDRTISIDSASMILGAFAASSHFSKELFVQVADFLQRMLVADSQISPEFLSRISLAYAVVGLHAQDGSRKGKPVKALFETIGELFSKRVWEFGPGALASIGWSFAILGLLEEEWDPPQRMFFQHWRAAVAVLSHERGTFSTESLSKIYQTELVIRLHIPELYTGADISESALLTSYFEGLYQAGAAVNLSQQAWSMGLLYGPRHMTYFHTDVAEVLDQMEIPYLLEVDGGGLLPSGQEDSVDLPLPLPYSVDLAIVLPGIPLVAVEVDGPAHFTRNCTPPLPLGRTILKHHVLRSLGWKVISVPFFVWDHLSQRDGKLEYMRNSLEQALGLTVEEVARVARDGIPQIKEEDRIDDVEGIESTRCPTAPVPDETMERIDSGSKEMVLDRIEKLEAIRARRLSLPLEALRRASIRRRIAPPLEP